MTRQLTIESRTGGGSYSIKVDSRYVGSVHEISPGVWLLDKRNQEPGFTTSTIKGTKSQAIHTLIGIQDGDGLAELLEHSMETPQDA